MLDGDMKTDIFFVADFNQPSLFKILEYTEKEIRYAQVRKTYFRNIRSSTRRKC